MRRSQHLFQTTLRAQQHGRCPYSILKHQYSTSSSFISRPLNEPLVSNGESSNLERKHTKTGASSKAQISKLDNGLTVASLDNVGASCTLGVLVNSGPKDECRFQSGVSHFLEKLAFNATDAFPSREELVEEMVRCGGIFECQVGKDVTIYAMSGNKEELESLVHVLGEVVLRPKITEEEMNATRQTIDYEIQAMRMLPPPDNILSELIHKAAYDRNTYGLPKYCPAENISLISRSDLLKFLGTYYRPERMVVAGVGVSHDHLLRHIQTSFVSGSASPWAAVAVESGATTDSVSQYTGGVAVEKCDLAAYHQPMPEFAHIVLGLEGCANVDDQYVAAAVLQTMMGGGGSFSAGGPGKGMFTRLFVNVLNQYHWVNSAVSQYHAYSDTGLFVISASAEPKFIQDLVQVIAGEMRAMTGAINHQELARAKRQLQSTLLMNMEYRPVAMEDLGRQILAYGHQRAPEWWFDKIEQITAEDVRDIAHRMLQTKPSLVGFGRVDKLPPYETVVRLLTSKEKFIPRIFSMYK